MDPSILPQDQGFWVHHISPFALVLWHASDGTPVGIRWYGLAYLAGLTCGYLLVRRWVRQRRVPLQTVQIQDFVLWAGLGMIIGGRLGYCLFYAADELVRDPLELFKLWHGGMASHGGIIGLAVGCWLYARKERVSFWVLGDVISAAGPIGVIFGRIANFINGELWGRPTRVPWAVIFPDPTAAVGGHAVPRHPSQLYAAVLEGLIPFLVALPIHARHRRPGLTTGVVLACYAVGRFVDECFREPDAGQPGGPPLAGHEAVPRILGFMSKGQALTLPVMAFAIVMIAWAMMRKPRPELYAPEGGVAAGTPGTPARG
jgi:phosphatidylglycerol:prolipoprotein diacylglycerol transferase